jgi:hypothetical protein
MPPGASERDLRLDVGARAHVDELRAPRVIRTSRRQKRKATVFIARWHFSVRFGHTQQCIDVLRKWEVDVGQRVGWKAGAIRVLSGLLGASDTDIEFEVRVDSLTDLESAWADIEKVPYHKQLMKELEGLVAGSTSRWTVHRVAELTLEGN